MEIPGPFNKVNENLYVNSIQTAQNIDIGISYVDSSKVLIVPDTSLITLVGLTHMSGTLPGFDLTSGLFTAPTLGFYNVSLEISQPTLFTVSNIDFGIIDVATGNVLYTSDESFSGIYGSSGNQTLFFSSQALVLSQGQVISFKIIAYGASPPWTLNSVLGVQLIS